MSGQKIIDALEEIKRGEYTIIQPQRELTRYEQEIFSRALRRSIKLVSTPMSEGNE